MVVEREVLGDYLFDSLIIIDNDDLQSFTIVHSQYMFIATKAAQEFLNFIHN
jgi:hypothetical protein